MYSKAFSDAYEALVSKAESWAVRERRKTVREVYRTIGETALDWDTSRKRT